MMIRGVLFDMDGVLYHGSRRLDGVLEFFDWLPVPYCFVTNNSSRTPHQVAEKLATMRVPATPDQIMTSAIVAAHYLTQHAPPHARVFAIGEVGLQTALEDANFELTESKPDYVVVGLDRAFTDQKLQRAVQALNNGATFIATNMDMILMTQDGALPGTGTIVRQVMAASGQTPQVMGKPERQMFQMAADYLQQPFNNLLMIGDNLETDIRGALQHGLYAAFMLTGVSTQDDLLSTTLQPHIISPHLQDLKHQLADHLPR